MKRGVRLLVKGNVKNLEFYQFLKQCADKLGIQGCLQDFDQRGLVMVLIGDNHGVEQMIDSLYKGNGGSAAAEIEVVPTDVSRDFRGVFRIIVNAEG